MTKRMALIDTSNNKVLQIIVTEDDWTGGNWYETTSDNYAVIGGTYSIESGKFIDIQPYASWTLNSDKKWQAPITEPTLTSEEQAAGKYYVWNESLYQSDNTKGWVLGTHEEHHS
tara:strand:- start:1575 stop:1919 length:345 start_codon:yes stop_codon:yes gene_type:complete